MSALALALPLAAAGTAAEPEVVERAEPGIPAHLDVVKAWVTNNATHVRLTLALRDLGGSLHPVEHGDGGYYYEVAFQPEGEPRLRAVLSVGAVESMSALNLPGSRLTTAVAAVPVGTTMLVHIDDLYYFSAQTAFLIDVENDQIILDLPLTHPVENNPRYTIREGMWLNDLTVRTSTREAPLERGSNVNVLEQVPETVVDEGKKAGRAYRVR